MDTVVAAPPSLHSPSWREVVWPKEHGSWSLALEPLAIGLLVAPSWGGLALAVAVVAAFFARRPVRIGLLDPKPARRDVARRAAVTCGAIALTSWFGALAAAGPGWSIWLLPSGLAGAVFLSFDLRQAGREEYAEIAGAAAFGWLPAVLATVAGWPPWQAIALGLVMLARAIPTVFTVRAYLRARKTGLHQIGWPVSTAVVGALIAAALVYERLAPSTAAAILALLALRSALWLVYPRPTWRASTLGMIEAALGVVFVVAVATAWRL